MNTRNLEYFLIAMALLSLPLMWAVNDHKISIAIGVTGTVLALVAVKLQHERHP